MYGAGERDVNRAPARSETVRSASGAQLLGASIDWPAWR